MKKATICLLCKGDNLLLGIKNRGPGAGKRNAPGGKVKKRETIKLAGKREIFEEAGIQIEEMALKLAALVRFYFENKFVFESYVLLVKDFKGKVRDTEEMDNFQLYPFKNLPFDNMWAGDNLWMPLVLSGKTIEAVVVFNADGTVVKDFSYKEVEFD